jgi:hypothetical protein
MRFNNVNFQFNFAQLCPKPATISHKKEEKSGFRQPKLQAKFG